MRFGLTKEELDLLFFLVVDPLKKAGCKVWIFGSRAREDHQKFSDIDLLYEVSGSKKLSSGLISEIKENSEESRLPYKVDLVQKSDLAASYKSSVEKDLIEL